jgi:hypothetical protein
VLRERVAPGDRDFGVGLEWPVVFTVILLNAAIL